MSSFQGYTNKSLGCKKVVLFMEVSSIRGVHIEGFTVHDVLQFCSSCIHEQDLKTLEFNPSIAHFLLLGSPICIAIGFCHNYIAPTPTLGVSYAGGRKL